MDNSDETIPQLDGPLGLAPNLAQWGIDSPEPGLCEDTYENRRILRLNGARWNPVFTTDGHPTNLIQVITEEMRTAQLSMTKEGLLTDIRNPDSDYKSGFKLVIIPGVENMVPGWVMAASRHWEAVEEEREKRGPNGKPYRPALAGPPQRCRAHTLSGRRCASWANGRVDSNGLCRTHMANQPHDAENPGIHTQAKARARLLSATEGAVDELESLMTNATSEPVRLGAAKEILDRAGIRGGYDINQEVTVKVVPAEEVVRKRLEAFRERALEMEAARIEAERQRELEALIVDAEEVEDE